MQEVIAVKVPACGNGIDECECGLRSVYHGYRHGAVQRHDGRGLKGLQGVIEMENLLPIGVLSPSGAAMYGSDRRLYTVRSGASLKRGLH